MIVLKKEKEKKKGNKKPYYRLRFYYMIGDANGETHEDVEISKDNPFLERFYTLLNKLQPVKGSWGLQLSEEDLRKCFLENQICREEYNFLKRMMFEDEGEEAFMIFDNDEDYADEFADGVRSESEYSFLVFQGLDLVYFDEFGKKHKAEVK